ncbi:MAG: adenylyl-sulfate kinase, partial [Xanthomonadaceae bacterium]|nr:adenylyl-sulfate kinase [Xanthomonadaceae bacterium]
MAALGEPPDFSRLLDGLALEREQGITIDVAYRYFSTVARDFIVADCPGHAQYTRNMATGASTASLALVLVDARKGVLTQTRRHSYICALLGIRRVVLAVNKLDLVEFDATIFAHIEAEYRELAVKLGIDEVTAIPLSALQGDNLVAHSSRTPWYRGPTLLEFLEQVPAQPDADAAPMRLPVQWVNRSGQDFRGYAGNLVSGRVAVGDAVIALPSTRRTLVARVFDGDKDVQGAVAGQAITVTLQDEIDIARGDVIAAAHDAPEVADQFAAHILWMDEAPLMPGRLYFLQLGPASAVARVTAIRHRIDVDTQESMPATRLEMNEVGYVHLSLDHAIAFEPYAKDRALGGFVLIDRQSFATAACGTLDFALRRAANIHWQTLSVDRSTRAASLQQHPRCLWFTGLSGAGKSTIANQVEQRLHTLGRHTYLLDGDNVRHGLNRDLGFTAEDRVENIRRVAEVARLMVDAGLIVLVSFISPFRDERRMARDLFGAGDFAEVYVDTPIEVCEKRDVKGLYAKARAGELRNFTGVDSPYEAPLDAELHLRTENESVDALARRVVEFLERA